MARADRVREVLYVNENPKKLDILEISRQYGLYFVKVDTIYGIREFTMSVRQFNKYMDEYNKSKKEHKS